MIKNELSLFENSTTQLSLYGRYAIASSLTPVELIQMSQVSRKVHAFFNLYNVHLKKMMQFFKVTLAHQAELENLENESFRIVRKPLRDGISLLAYQKVDFWQIYLHRADVYRKGNSKEVFLAYDPCQAQLVALSNIKDSPKEVMEEREVVSRFTHRNIQNIQDVFHFQISQEAHGVMAEGSSKRHTDSFLVMPWATGGDLKDSFNDSRIFFSDFQLYDICLQIAFGLKEIHDKNLVLCDLKAENILINPESIKITDFGHFQKSGEPWKKRGTTTMFPPESRLSDLSIQPSFDIWSLALVLFFIGTRGRASFIENAMEKIWAKKAEPHPFRKFNNPHWIRSCLVFDPNSKFPCLQNLLVKMLSFEPAKRPTISMVIQELSKYRSHFVR